MLSLRLPCTIVDAGLNSLGCGTASRRPRVASQVPVHVNFSESETIRAADDRVVNLSCLLWRPSKCTEPEPHVELRIRPPPWQAPSGCRWVGPEGTRTVLLNVIVSGHDWGTPTCHIASLTSRPQPPLLGVVVERPSREVRTRKSNAQPSGESMVRTKQKRPRSQHEHPRRHHGSGRRRL